MKRNKKYKKKETKTKRRKLMEGRICCLSIFELANLKIRLLSVNKR